VEWHRYERSGLRMREICGWRARDPRLLRNAMRPDERFVTRPHCAP
jgi:hypothetical protein